MYSNSYDNKNYNDYASDYDDYNDKIYDDEIDYSNDKDYNDYNDYDEYKDLNYNNRYYYNDEEEDDENNNYNKINKYQDNMEFDTETDLNKDIDDDLAEYFSDARVFSASAKKNSNKKRNKRIIYKVDDKIIVMANKIQNKGQIIFGPYDVNKKAYYQIELADGNIIEADEKHICYQQ